MLANELYSVSPNQQNSQRATLQIVHEGGWSEAGDVAEQALSFADLSLIPALHGGRREPCCTFVF